MRLALISLFLFAASASAGVHYSGEVLRPLPAKWSGYLPDHRLLRAVATAPVNPTQPVPLLRGLYTEALLRLQAQQKQAALSADQLADLGALHLRLGEPEAALKVLQPAARQHPRHYPLQSNLGTAWQLLGDLDQAAAALTDAVELAPPRYREVERLQLQLVRSRAQAGKRSPSAPETIVPLNAAPSANTLALVQHLAFWLPSDGPLLWLLGELAYLSGDVRTAANILDGCVTELNLGSPRLRENRLKYRTQAEELDRLEKPTTATMTFASSRALLRSVDPAQLPKIQPGRVNLLPWAVVNETEIGPRGRPAFLKYLEDLDGETVTFAGYMTNLTAAGDETSELLLTENPVGCWFCETPMPNQLLRVELEAGKTVELTRMMVKITGTLRLNRTDPERLPVQVVQAKVSAPD